jgi:hypothetical protein
MKPTVSAAAAEINNRAPRYRIGNLQQIRQSLKKFKRALPVGIFRQQTIFEEDGYAFHFGGRRELQFNIGFEPENRFRFGIAFSFEPNQNLPDVTLLTPKVQRFNDFVSAHPEQFSSLRMWTWENNKRSAEREVGPISNEEIRNGAFVFIGKTQSADTIDYDAVLETFDDLLPLYEYVEGEARQNSRERFAARICWNSNGWVFPSGDAKELETGSYVTRAGFGHEEWLFNFAWKINGYHYAFLQPVSDSINNVAGKHLDLLLFSINPMGDRLYVGEIRNCEILTSADAEPAVRHYKKAGWLRSMKEQVEALGGDASKLDDGSLFNVRFKPTDAELYQPLRLAEKRDFVNKLNRYKLAVVENNLIAEWRRRKGTKIPPTIRTITRSGQPTVIYDPVHVALQGKLFELLKNRYGKNNVEMEADYVDLTVIDEQRKILIEIKSDADARIAIRNALGQVLEYAYLRGLVDGYTAELVVVAPAPLTAAVSNYIERLRKKFGIPLTYCPFSLGDSLPDFFN